MKKSNTALIVLMAGSILLIAILLIAGPKLPTAEKKGPAAVNVEIDFGGQTPDRTAGNSSGNANWSFRLEMDNATVYSALLDASEKFNFTVKADWYPNFGSHRVSEIAGVRDGADGRFWQYYVNGQYMDKGGDLVGLADGDTVRWEFKGALQR
jgi:hypothetical protein